MKKNFLYTALFALMLASCSEQEVIEQPSTPTGGTEVPSFLLPVRRNYAFR